MPDIPLHLIRPNPFRNFDLHPYDEAQIERLQASIDKLGFWDGVVARPYHDTYQLAFGHHRTEAARRNGAATVPITVADLSDADMALQLAVENATQRGTTAAASLDAVAALSRAITESCMASDTPELFRQIWRVSLTAAERIWGHVRAGGQPGRECIQKLLPKGTFTHHQVALALAVLRSSGHLGKEQVTFDAGTARLFQKDDHLQAFRRIVTDDTVSSYLPVDKQDWFAGQILTALTGQEVTSVRIREQANILFYEQLGIARTKMRRSSSRASDARAKDALNFIRRAAADVEKCCNILSDLIAEGVSVSPEVLDRFINYVRQIEGSLKSVANKGTRRKRQSNLRLIVDNKRETVA